MIGLTRNKHPGCQMCRHFSFWHKDGCALVGFVQTLVLSFKSDLHLANIMVKSSPGLELAYEGLRVHCFLHARA